MGNIIPTALDVRKARFLQPQVATVATAFDTKIKAYKQANQIPLKANVVASLTGIVNANKTLPALAKDKRIIFNVQDDSRGHLFVKYADKYEYLFTINGRNSPLNNFAIRINTDIKFIFVYNTNHVVKWSFQTYPHDQTIVNINKKFPRTFQCDVYNETPTIDLYLWVDNDEKGVITKQQPAVLANFVLDWTHCQTTH
ncbi:hypothetical protein PPL_04307 [Heterostelium album PN500]|uniref:Uncharacterized protein n=1 Tax=Heterostelium pallidum (strain ATCC 26659 / Pp 5 / PN500) TaxID=670386 RepID=D3B772_HETP5|nr:hypothetical protein PPL_04307 [Heterostelium album PN500]EFA82615.1 hypothetical protein PPL_04307 [Heterostelium album PN500]|eukprot:XP_020434732.1 hypothetical protein PPL_04307 [Heterostelium album PN500]